MQRAAHGEQQLGVPKSKYVPSLDFDLQFFCDFSLSFFLPLVMALCERSYGLPRVAGVEFVAFCVLGCERSHGLPRVAGVEFVALCGVLGGVGGGRTPRLGHGGGDERLY